MNDMEEQKRLAGETAEDKELTCKQLTAKAQSLLLHRYPMPEWATFLEVQGMPSHDGKVHFADCLAFNMFNSRGFMIIGFEIKASRADWLNELKNGSKADYFVGQCDEWYIVEAKEGIVKHEELPIGWGLLSHKNDKLRIKVHSKLDHKGQMPSREFFIRAIQKCYDKHNPESLIWEAEQRGMKKGREESIEREIQDYRKKAELIKKMCDMGLHLWEYDKREMDELLMAISLIQKLKSGGWNMLSELEYVENQCTRIINMKKECEEKIKKISRSLDFKEVEACQEKV